MRATLSTPMQLILAITIVGSTVFLLRSEHVELPLPAVHPKPAATARPLVASETMRVQDRPWSRPQVSQLTASKIVPVNKSGIPPLPPAGNATDASRIPPLPPLPAALNQPDVTYLGRMIQNGKEQVFLSSNGEPVVLGAGDILNGIWRIQSISSTNIAMLHVQTNERRLIATGGSGSTPAVGTTSVQVGQAFLRSASSESTPPETRQSNE